MTNSGQHETSDTDVGRQASSPVRVQLKRRKGWRLPANTVSVARPGKWGNPFTVENSAGADPVQRFAEEVAPSLNVKRLRGKNLACWCRLDEPCHADVLLKLANP